MKKILIIILILNCGICFSQTKKDYSEIIELAVSSYETDTVKIFKRFDNKMLLSSLEMAKSKQDNIVFEKYKNLEDSTKSLNFMDQQLAELFDDSVTVEIENIKVALFKNQKWINKKK